MRKIVIEEMKCELHTFIMPDDCNEDVRSLVDYAHDIPEYTSCGIQVGKHYISYTHEPGHYELNTLEDETDDGLQIKV